MLRRLEIRTADGNPLDGGLRLGAPFETRVGLVLQRPTLEFEVILCFDNVLGQRLLVAKSLFDTSFAR